MASQFAPESLPIVDPGNVPEFWIDGLAACSERGAVIRAAYYSFGPAICGAPCVWHPEARLLAVKLVFPVPALEMMRRQVDTMREGRGVPSVVTAMTC